MQKTIDFVCVGPQRTASSWLDRALRAHPQLSLPENVKETFFFDHYFERGSSWYADFFADPVGDRMLGEVGSTYFESSKALERILQHNPVAKIIIMVRNPVARTFSSYGHEYARGHVRTGFHEAVEQEPRIVDSGRYSVLAPRWEDAFGPEHVLYLLQEDIQADPQAQMDLLYSFLGISRVDLPTELRGIYGQGSVPRNWLVARAASQFAWLMRTVGLHRIVEAGKRVGLKRVYSGGDSSKLDMTRAVFDYLQEIHESDIQYLERRLGRVFPHWREADTYGL